MKAYKVEVLVIDFDGLGADDVAEAIENVNFPNDCVRPHVMSVTTKEIGEWHDDHPLNKINSIKQEFKRLFGEARTK